MMNVSKDAVIDLFSGMWARLVNPVTWQGPMNIIFMLVLIYNAFQLTLAVFYWAITPMLWNGLFFGLMFYCLFNQELSKFWQRCKHGF
jgi:hypothetical protein